MPSREATSLGITGQLSPICLSPNPKGQNMRRTKREGGCSGSIKRLFSPPEESHNAKRPRTIISLTGSNLTRSVLGHGRTPHFSSDQLECQSERSEGHRLGTGVVFNESRHPTVSLKSVSCHRKHQEERDEAEKDFTGFTVITEQRAVEVKTTGNPPTRLDTPTLTTAVHKPSAQTITPAPQAEATRTAVTSQSGDKGPSSNQDQAGGNIVIILTKTVTGSNITIYMKNIWIIFRHSHISDYCIEWH